MKKYMLDMKVTANERLHTDYCLLKLTCARLLPDMRPGQFVQVRVDDSPTTFLRRPVSIHYVDRTANELWLLVHIVGDGTRRMGAYKAGDIVNVLLPLGNGFTIPRSEERELLLIGGGVGAAPLLYLGAVLKQAGHTPVFLLGARGRDDVLQRGLFERLGDVYITTEDGSLGEKGYVTDHPVLAHPRFGKIYACGPKPMMAAVARYADSRSVSCEVSLENTMACGIGACLCCVEKLDDGHHACVCTEGPVFDSKKLTWLN